MEALQQKNHVTLINICLFVFDSFFPLIFLATYLLLLCGNTDVAVAAAVVVVVIVVVDVDVVALLIEATRGIIPR